MTDNTIGVLSATSLVVRKNALLKVRKWQQTLLEIILPALFTACLIPAWLAVGTDKQEATTYVDANAAVTNYTALFEPLKCSSDFAVYPSYPECSPEWVTNDTCIGHLCMMLPADDQSALGSILSPLYSPNAATIPDYDTLALIRKFSRAVEIPGTTEYGENVPNALSTGVMTAVVPGAGLVDHSLVESLETFLASATYTHAFISQTANPSFATEKSALDFIKSRAGSRQVWALVVLHGPNSFDIRMNTSATPTTQKEQSDSMGFDTTYRLYHAAGFITVQNLVNWWIVDPQQTSHPATDIMKVFPMPVAAYDQNLFISGAGGFMPLILTLALLFSVSQMVASIVREKETRIREAMLIMGLPSSSFKLSWLTTIWAQMFVTGVFVGITMGVSLLNNTDISLILVLFVLYCLSLGSFSILLSVFFSKGSTAVVLSPLLFFATALPGFILQSDTTGDGTKQVLSFFFSNYAFAQGIDQLCSAAGSGTPLAWDTAGRGGYSFATVIWWLFMSNVLYLLLSLYFDMVLPSEWGAKKPFYFVCDPRYWLGLKYKKNEGYRGMSADEEQPAGSELREVVRDEELMKMERVSIKNVTKEFNNDGAKRMANDNVSLSLYEGQILALLGHNGAGKTTLINMLTGMLPLTSGDATVYGHSIVSDMAKVRTSVGLCPQHNILWDNMTCFEHMMYYAALKGVASERRKAAAMDMLDGVGLDDKHHVYSASLSGGMKRKLSVAISLIGDSKFVILDEPTAGMDVQARRAIWDLLKDARKGRTILLTTHFMDEADLLGDSIAIMSAGKVYCCGSSFFLKQKLGVGYNLKMDLSGDKSARDRRIPQITLLLKNEIGHEPAGELQKVELLASAGAELTYRIPMWGLPSFATLFEALEQRGTEYGITNFGMSVTTLEEIFIKVAHDATPIVPVIQSGTPTAQTPLLNGGNSQTLDDNLKCINIDESDRLHGRELTASQWKGLFYKRLRYSVRDRKTVCFQVILPVVLVVYTLALAGLPVPDRPALSVDSYKYFSQTPLAPLSSPWFPLMSRNNMDVQNISSNELPGDESENPVYRMNQWLLSTANTRGIDDDRWQAACQDDFTIETPSFDNYFSIFHNSTAYHAIPIVLSQLATSQFRSVTGDAEAKISTTNNPLPFSDYTRDMIDGFIAITIGISLLVPFAFIPANFISFLVEERESKAKHVQLVSGVQLSAYWASTFAWDFVSFCFSSMLSFIVFFLFDRTEYVGSLSTFMALVALFFFYGLCAISSTYLMSFYFASQTTAKNIVMAFNFTTGVVLVLVVFILKVFPSTEVVGEVLRYVFRLIPCYCLGDGMVTMAQLPAQRRMGVTDDTAWAMDVIGWDILFLALSFPFYMLAALAHDFPQILYKLKLKKQGLVDTESPTTDIAEDEDVALERKTVLKGRAGDVVTVHRLRKVFPAGGGNPKPKVAVRDLTFGVKQDEIFAFLGTNGAGKTTTISVLAGDYTPTSGTATIKGYDVVTQAQEAKRELGYCPQFDALIDLLTPREHLAVYCSLRGVPYHLRSRMSEALMEVLDLKEYADTICKKLSGGNKRKTSIAISLVGGPSCILLDEPTAGIDPVARRGMWTALQSLSGGRSVILTTHHLEEVEALAHRTAIMVDGGLQCLGSLTHLKAKFGGAYEIQLKTDGPHEAAARAFFASDPVLSHATLIEATNHRLTYQVPVGTKLSALFRIVQASRDEVGILDYSISQTSLEQVFIAICKKYVESADAEGKEEPATKEEPRNSQSMTLFARR
ncbi:ABC transporter A family member 1 [Diplonema papillatum]|nr:ABC transporter A family member 1 [Diplonema papillatum]KAJ9441058.1 ABC transporter A family member 1 [Diplonema papillatum]